MYSSSAQRAAALAVSKYGLDRARVEEVYERIVRSRGNLTDFLDTLLEERLLTIEQCDALRLDLELTALDAVDTARTKDQLPRNSESAASNPSPVEAGEPRILGEVRILRRLGEGGMGAVYLGYHEGLDCQVAVKVLADHLANSRVSVDRFYREARTGALLDHPHIVRGITAGQDRVTGKHYLVLEFIDGPSASALLEHYGRLPIGDAGRIVLDIARALEYLHARNFVHRDIKPDNILLMRTGIAKLSDLGLAKRIGETSHLTALHQGFGTPYYMPYEQALNARTVDGRSDIYALGATMYHLIAGEVPFAGQNHEEVVERKSIGAFRAASALNPEVPAELDRILARMLARDPRDRYQTATDVIGDLERTTFVAAVPSFVNLEPTELERLLQERRGSIDQRTHPNLEPAKIDSGDAGAKRAELSSPEVPADLSPDDCCKPCRFFLGATFGLGVLAASALVYKLVITS
jgi:serine/threonine-protein kinase